MKAFLLLLVLVLAGAGVYQFYLKDHPVSFLQGSGAPQANPTSPAPASKKDFKDISALLQGDMDRIPHDLRNPRQMPTHAYDVKSRVAPYLQLHEEYRTLTQVCDTIIGADQDFDERQGKCGLRPVGPGATAQEKARAASGPSTAAYQQQEPLWDGRRKQAESEVHLKLSSLENHRL